MQYKEYGKTGKKVSVIGFGGMRFPKENDTYNEEYCSNMIYTARELGINYFDTAPGYNDDMSEILYGNAFKNMPKDFYVSTKSASKDGSEVRRSLERSLKRLHLEKIDFFNIWCVLNMEDFHSRMVKGGAYDALLKAKEEKLIDHICFTTHCTGKDIAAICDMALFDGVTLGYNIVNSVYRQEGIQGAYRNNMAVVTMNPLGGGLIPRNQDYFSYIKTDENQDVIDAAIKFNSSHKEITVVLTGMDSIEHVKKNATSGNAVPPYQEDLLDTLQSHSTQSMDSLCTGCQYCEYCPKEINISKLMLAYNRQILGEEKDMKHALKYHWRISPDQATDCIACGLCESKCTQHLPIISRLKEIADSFNLTQT